MNSNSNKGASGEASADHGLVTASRLKAGGLVLGACGLVWLASMLDPSNKPREIAYVEFRAADEGAEAKVRELVPEAGRAAAGTRVIGFADLAFDVPLKEVRNLIKTGYAPWLPPSVKALDGNRVRIEGYMLPTQLEDGKAKECLILANQLACCYGQAPRFCEFIVARVKGAAVPALQDRPLVFEGTLKIADVYEGGAWMSLYAMELDSVGR